MSADTPEDAPTASTTASGQGSVAVGGDVRDSTVITGNSNVIYIGGRPVPWWRILAGLVVVLAGAVAVYVFYPRPIPDHGRRSERGGG